METSLSKSDMRTAKSVPAKATLRLPVSTMSKNGSSVTRYTDSILEFQSRRSPKNHEVGSGVPVDGFTVGSRSPLVSINRCCHTGSYSESRLGLAVRRPG